MECDMLSNLSVYSARCGVETMGTPDKSHMNVFQTARLHWSRSFSEEITVAHRVRPTMNRKTTRWSSWRVRWRNRQAPFSKRWLKPSRSHPVRLRWAQFADEGWQDATIAAKSSIGQLSLGCGNPHIGGETPHNMPLVGHTRS